MVAEITPFCLHAGTSHVIICKLCCRLFQTFVASLLCTAVTFINMNTMHAFSSRTSRTDKISAGWQQLNNLYFFLCPRPMVFV